MDQPRVTVFGPNPLLTVTIEPGGEGGPGPDSVHVHGGGQGVWVTRMAAEIGADTTLCGLIGGETGTVLEPLLERLPGDRRLISTRAPSSCVVTDRRSGERVLVAGSLAPAADRHEVDELVSTGVAAGLASDALAVCDAYPEGAVPDEAYATLVADVRANGVPVLCDLSAPRLDAALEGRPMIVKINDWQLAGYVSDSVEGPVRLAAAAQRVREAGAEAVIVTRGGEPALAIRDGEELWVEAPRFERGAREGCGDSMMGALAVAIARGDAWEDALRLAAAAGAANFLRHGLGSGDSVTVSDLVGRVEVRPAQISTR